MSGGPEKPVNHPVDGSSRERAERRAVGSGTPQHTRGNTDPLVRTDRLDHVHLYVHDRPAAIAWYRRVLGLKIFGSWQNEDPPDDHPVFLAPATGGPHVLSLFVGDRPQGGDRTVAFHAHARGFLGFARALPDDDLLSYDGTPLTADKHHDYGLALTFNFLDPAGNHIELATYDHEEVRQGLAEAAP